MLIAACGGNGGDFVLSVGRLNCAAVAGFDSYHYDSSVLIEVKEPADGAATAPMDPSPFVLSWKSQVDAEDAGDLVEGVVKTNDSGRESLVDVVIARGTVWQQSDPNVGYISSSEGSTSPFPFPPEDICLGLSNDIDLAALTGVPEKVNGIRSAKYTLAGLPAGVLADAVSVGGGDMATVVDSYDGAIWVTQDGYPVRLEISGRGSYEGGSTLRVEVSFEYSHVNDVDKEIVIPQRR